MSQKTPKPQYTHSLCVCFTVDVRQEMLEEAQRKLMNLVNTTEGKVDKWVYNADAFHIYLSKNIFKGVFLWNIIYLHDKFLP